MHPIVIKAIKGVKPEIPTPLKYQPISSTAFYIHINTRLALLAFSLDAKYKIKNMEHPHTGKHKPPYRNLIHHNESNRHQRRHHNHDLDLRFPCHAPAVHIAFQIILIQFCPGKPAMQLV